MENTVRTVYGNALQTAQLIGKEHVVLPFTSLNERFAIQASAVHTPGTYPRVGYWCIGNGGHDLVIGSGGVPIPSQKQHRSTDASLYRPIPFALRAIADDLTPLQRSKYALRKQITVAGDQYWAYYLKKIPLGDVVVRMQLETITSGNTVAVDFIPDTTNLNPVPPVIPNVGASVLVSEYLTVSARLNDSLTEEECTEITNASIILYGDASYALISEIGLCAGQEKVIVIEDSTNFSEVIATQIISHVATLIPIQWSATGVTGILDLGTSEPLLALA